MDLSIVDLIGFAASGFVFLTFYMRTLLSLRLVAIVSNVLFIGYGLIADLVPILVLHLILFPMNALRAYQQIQSIRLMRHVIVSPPEIDHLLPLMTRVTMGAGECVFQKGDMGDRLYIVIEGEVRAEEIDKTIPAGGIFGEIALFSEDSRRTATVVCVGPVTLAWVDRGTILKLFRDQPDFALALTKLITSRASENQSMLLSRMQGQATMAATPA